MLVCKKCGWEYPDSTLLKYCKFCHRRIYRPPEPSICEICGELKIIHYSGICQDCRPYTTATEYDSWYRRVYSPGYSQNRLRKVRSKATKKLQDHTTMIEAIPKPYKFLTEQEWIKACNYFNGCAMCGSETIEARVFFVPFRYGGRYCAWNVIPACSKCATRTPSKNLNPYYTEPPTHFSKERVERALEYLLPLLKEAACLE